MIRFFMGFALMCCTAVGNGQHITVLHTGGQPAAYAVVALQPLAPHCPPVRLVADSRGVARLQSQDSCFPYLLHIIAAGDTLYTDTIFTAADHVALLPFAKQQIEEVVVTAQYAPNSLNNAVQRIEVIDRKKIDAMGAQTLRDALTNQLDIRLTQDPIFGTALSMQGSKAYGADAKILIDGVPVTGKQNGAVDLSQINLANIERIEIIKGPMSVSYGADAIAGAVNLITRKRPARNIEANATAYYESIGGYNLNGRVAMRRKRHSIAVDGGRNFFDGWKPGDKQFDLSYADRPADTLRTSLWKPREQYIANMLYSYAAPHTTLTYKAGFFNELIENRGAPLLPYREIAFDDRYYTRRNDNALFLDAAIGEHKHVNTLLAYNQYRRIKNTVTNDLTSLQTTPTPNAQDTSAYSELTARGTFSGIINVAKLNYELGYDINMQYANSAQIAGRKQDMANYALFASAEYKLLKQLTIRPGLRYGYNTRYGAPLIPSVNVLWKANEWLNIRAAYGKGFRQPGLKELYFDFVDINHNIYGNKDLQAESADNYSVAASYSCKRNSATYKIQSSVFYNSVERLITLAAVSGGATNEYTYVNIGRFISKGAQVSGDVVCNAFTLSAGAALTGMYNQLSETAQAPKFSYSPEVRGAATVNIGKGLASVAVFYKYTGSIATYTITNNEPLQTTTGSYHTADVTASKSLCHKQLRITGGCKNLFNVATIPSVQAGSAHSGGSGDMAIGAGRYYFLKLDYNIR